MVDLQLDCVPLWVALRLDGTLLRSPRKERRHVVHSLLTVELSHQDCMPATYSRTPHAILTMLLLTVTERENAAVFLKTRRPWLV